MIHLFKRFSNIGIRKKLILSFLIILIVPGFIIGSVSYQTAKENFKNQITAKANENIAVLDTFITQNLEAKFVDVSHFADILTEDTYQGEKIENVKTQFSQYSSIHPEVEGIYFGTQDEVFVREPSIQMPEGYKPTDRPWYKDAIKDGDKVIVTAPYESSSTKNMVVTIAKRTKDGKGVVGVNLNLANMSKTTKMFKIGEKGYVTILDQNRQVVSHPTRKSGSKVTEAFINPAYEKQQGYFSYNDKGDNKILSFKTNNKTGWKFIGVMYEDEITKAAEPVFYKTLIVVTISVLLGGILVYFITKSITGPLRAIVVSAQKISQGDLTEEIAIHSNDELGRLGASFNEMAASLRNVISKMSNSAEHVAASAEELTSSVRQANEATDQITLAMEQVSSSAQSQSQGVEEGAALLQQVNTAIQNVTDSSKVISSSSAYARQKAEEGGELVQQTASQMQSIHQSVSQSDTIIKLLDEKSKQIGAILEVIQNIAQQTNLLALNAAIEAARAGEQGRGFAIVAEEVRKLAEQSGQSSGEIAKLITEIKDDIECTVQSMDEVKIEVQSGLEAVDKTKTSFADILNVTNDIVSQINHMATTAKRMSEDANEVTDAIDEIAAAAEENTASMQNVAASSEEQMNSMEEISSSAQNLAQMSEELQLMIQNFKL
ncbi:methyl-accepting chemotaxis protein [Bacillus sp. S13(2024)]|uniref:methyl-accepting chemotaxis protein n=1 Tax=unclassified Bacillus (in: firmicutes) TaxID=185979 RepID=UPI003D1F041C